MSSEISCNNNINIFKEINKEFLLSSENLNEMIIEELSLNSKY